MPSSPNGPLRRGQLVAPFGVGSMVIIRGGIGLITCGLDHWYKYEDGTTIKDPQEFQIEEWRLQRALRVSHFRLPPDYRRPQKDVPNADLTVPFLKFPQWHFCPGCRRLEKRPLTERSKVKCPECEKQRRTRYMVQVPFVAMCDQGHLQDFPWREWVHKSAKPTCTETLRLVGTGSASLAGQIVKCDCGQSRSLSGITEAQPDGTKTTLSEKLEDGTTFLCQGITPWLGREASASCSSPLRGSLRSSSNIYFAQVKSAIYLPRSNSDAPSDLIERFEEPPVSTFINIMLSVDQANMVTPSLLRMQCPGPLQDYTDKQLEAAISIIVHGKADNEKGHEPLPLEEDMETAFRREEFKALIVERNEELLTISREEIDRYGDNLTEYFSAIMLVNRLRETRAFAGFSRVFPENSQGLEDRKAMLWRQVPLGSASWLPAYVVYGEGIFLEFNEGRLQEWESQPELMSRIQKLANRYEKLQKGRKLRARPITPRFVLLHTFAHLVMNRLTFECGYSSAALRERIYVSDRKGAEMAGILIYTADGDAEGTMGGLVRMGKVGYLEPVIRRALEGAMWCSTDPVCMEMGSQNGQGPDSCNLAACHNCALVPETACEEFNRFLDRAVVIGQFGEQKLGYFDL